MTSIAPLSDMLNWKLLKGSHKFPGPEGGTCLNEAAIIAAGFPYTAVKSWRDCPPCFCPVIASFAIGLNDRMEDADRQALIPFVTRMAGSKGDVGVEKARRLWLARQVVNVDLAGVMHVLGQSALAEECAAAQTLDALRVATQKCKKFTFVDAVAFDTAAAAAAAAAVFAAVFAAAAFASKHIKPIAFSVRAVELLEGLFSIGAVQEVPVELAATRLNKARAEGVIA